MFFCKPLAIVLLLALPLFGQAFQDSSMVNLSPAQSTALATVVPLPLLPYPAYQLNESTSHGLRIESMQSGVHWSYTMAHIGPAWVGAPTSAGLLSIDPMSQVEPVLVRLVTDYAGGPTTIGMSAHLDLDTVGLAGVTFTVQTVVFGPTGSEALSNPVEILVL